MAGTWEESVSEEAGREISGEAVHAANEKKTENHQELQRRHAGTLPIGDVSQGVIMGGGGWR